MKKYKYVVTTGWWCKEKNQIDSRELLQGDDSIRDKEFFSLWFEAINKYTKPEKILIVDSASPVKPMLPEDPRVEIVSLDFNAGHSTNHIGKYAGVTRAHIMGMIYALSCDVDYWVYIEQDALIYGDGIVEYCIDNMEKEIMFGSGEGTAQPMQQSFMIIKKNKIIEFLDRFTSIKSRDNKISPEMKFAMAASAFTYLLPERMFYHMGSSFYNRVLRKFSSCFLKVTRRYDELPIGYGRKRPIFFDDEMFYFQHGSKAELESYYRLK